MDPQLDPDYLKPVSLLPPALQCVFPFRYFNAVQSESFAEVFLSDDNLVISAPTGSGKTVLFELCILRILEKSLTAEGHFEHVSGARKTVYIAPMKALVQDKLREWTQKFSSLGVKCQELTSDSESSNVLDMLDTDIILTTPEKFDVITRRHRDRGGVSFFGDIALLLIDEVHLLNETRGAALEAVVSRLKMLARFPEIKGCSLSTIRFVAVSATVSNIEDLGEWLRVPKNGIKRFGEEYRPVRLSTVVLETSALPIRYLDASFGRKAIAGVLLDQERSSRDCSCSCSIRISSWKSESLYKEFGALRSTASGSPENE